MKPLSDRQIIECAGTLLGNIGMLSAAEAQSLQTSLQRIESDGSTRRFWRVNRGDTSLCLIAAPAGKSEAELAESKAAWHIGNHLQEKGVAVPALYGWDGDSGILLYEDLGDLRLHDVIGGMDRRSSKNSLSGPAAEYYRQTLTHLAAMQVRGAGGFSEEWCWDSSRYDVAVMRDKESGYFLRAFWQGLMGEEVPPGVEEEFQEIAVQAGNAPADFFLHRDFQSRNIMLQDDQVRFIDFQGGRLGPLGYDVASLLVDPYAALALAEQEEFLDFYLQELAAERPGAQEDFHTYYRLLALQRNLQIVGAFSFLFRIRGKVFFADFIQPSLVSLRDRLAEPSFAGYPLIRKLVDRGLAGLAIR